MITEKKCENCNEKFHGTKRARFCSTKCRVANYRRENVQQVQENKTS